MRLTIVKPSVLIVPDSPIGQQFVSADVRERFKNEVQAFYGLEKMSIDLCDISENPDNFFLFYKSSKHNPVMIVRRFKKGRTINLTDTDYAAVNKKFQTQYDKIVKAQQVAKDLETRKGIAELILKGLTASDLKFEIQKQGIMIILLDNENSHHVSCLLNFTGIIDVPLIKLNYPHGKKVQIIELERLVKYSNEKIKIALKMAQQVKNMLPKEWFDKK